jgi:hypothetical protein
MESFLAVSKSCTAAKRRHEIASYRACLPFTAPLTDELAKRLTEQEQGDAVFAAGIARLFQHPISQMRATSSRWNRIRPGTLPLGS